MILSKFVKNQVEEVLSANKEAAETAAVPIPNTKLSVCTVELFKEKYYPNRTMDIIGLIHRDDTEYVVGSIHE
jgi:hypothetical protein